MSMLTEQTKRLRETAKEVKRIKNSSTDWLWMDSVYLASAAREMLDAADTIEELRNRLTETCRLERAQWDDGTCTWGCICTACDAHLEHETGIGYSYCPHCGRRVIE